MCRLLAVSGEPRAVRAFLQSDVIDGFEQRSRSHVAGWGLAWYGAGELQTVRRPGWVQKHPEFRRVLEELSSSIVLLHVRRATRGIVSRENTHPFRRGNWVFAHNGTIVNRVSRPLRKDLGVRFEGTTDSEVFFHFLLQSIDAAGGDVARGIRSAVHWVCARTATARLNFVLSNGTTTWAYRRGHTLFRFVEETERGRVEGVSSDALGRGWKTVNRDCLLSFDANAGVGRTGPFSLDTDAAVADGTPPPGREGFLVAG